MNDERLAELKEKYKDRNLFEELAWGAYADHSGYTSKQNGEFLNWLCMAAYKALKERPQGEWILISERLPEGKINPKTNDFESVLCSTVWDDVRPYKFGKPIGHDKAHFWWGCGVMDDYVIAWMPLPEPYKEETENE